MTDYSQKAREIIPDDSDQFFKNQKIDWTSIRYQISKHLLQAEEAGRKKGFNEGIECAAATYKNHCVRGIPCQACDMANEIRTKLLKEK